MFANFDAEEDFNTFSPAWNQPTKNDESVWDELDQRKEKVQIYEGAECKLMAQTPAFLAYEKDSEGLYEEHLKALKDAQGFSAAPRRTSGAYDALSHYESFLLFQEEDVLAALDEDAALDQVSGAPNEHAKRMAYDLRAGRTGATRVSSPDYPSRERGRKLYAAKCRGIALNIEFTLNNAAWCGPNTEALVAEILAD